MAQLTGVFIRSNGTAQSYRAERLADGSIWQIELLDADGLCFDSIQPHSGSERTDSVMTSAEAISEIERRLAAHLGDRAEDAALA